MPKYQEGDGCNLLGLVSDKGGNAHAGKATPSAPWSNGASQQWLRTSFGHINQRLDEIAESIASNNEAQAVIAHHQPLLLDELKKLNLAISQQEWIYNVDLRNYN